MKNNLFNKIFNRKELKKEIEKNRILFYLYPESKQWINGAQTLTEVLEIHKKLWKRGYRSEKIAPCKYGMFRTESIENMTEDEVYLGNILGLWTFNITEWNKKSDEDSLKIVIGQYKNHLLSGITDDKIKARNYLSKNNVL